MTHWSRVNKTT